MAIQYTYRSRTPTILFQLSKFDLNSNSTSIPQNTVKDTIKQYIGNWAHFELGFDLLVTGKGGNLSTASSVSIGSDLSIYPKNKKAKQKWTPLYQ